MILVGCCFIWFGLLIRLRRLLLDGDLHVILFGLFIYLGFD